MIGQKLWQRQQTKERINGLKKGELRKKYVMVDINEAHTKYVHCDDERENTKQWKKLCENSGMIVFG